MPSLVIDPKGDLGNLLLTFPDLRGKDFAPWINEDDARRKDLALREQRDAAVDRLRQTYAPKLEALQARLLRAQQEVARQSEQATEQKIQTAISFGATLLDAVFGRKAVSRTTIGRATRTARGVGRTMKESQDPAGRLSADPAR